MSNYTTILHNFDQPVVSRDFNTIVTALDSKQTAYTQNKAQLQSLYDQLDALKVAKGVDQDYIESRLQQVKEITNQYNYIDLSNSSFANALYDNVAQVIDDKVDNAVYSKKLLDAEDAMWKKKAEEGGTKYYEGNEKYAKYMSDRRRYYSTKEAGDKYGGGADFIEFQDVDKKALDQLQNIIKNATHEYMQAGPSSGQFTSLSTMEVISRPEVEAQLRASMNEKEWQQMKINAWNKYGGADDNYLRARKDEVDTNALAEIDDSLTAARSAASSASDEDKSKYEDYISRLESHKEAIQNNTYESLVARVGKEGIYTKLHEDEFFNEYLKGFSYEPREIKREIDQTRKAAIEFAEDQRQFNAQQSWERYKFENLSAKDQADLMYKAKELELKYPGSATPGQSNATKIAGDEGKAIIEPEEGQVAKGGLALTRKHEVSAKKAMESIFGELDSKDIYELRGKLSDENYAKAIQAGKIKINGKTVTLDKATIKVINEYKQTNLKTSPAKKAAIEASYDAIVVATNTIAKLSSSSSDQDINSFPSYGLKITGDSKTGFKVEQTKSKTYFKDLASRYRKNPKSLSEAETKTLQYYVGSNMVADPSSGLTTSQRAVMTKAIRTNILTGLTATEMGKLPITVDQIEAAHKSKAHKGNEAGVEINSDFMLNKVKSLMPYSNIRTMPSFTSKYTLVVPPAVESKIRKLSNLYQKVSETKDEAKRLSYKTQIKEVENDIKKVGSFVKGGTDDATNFISDISSWDAEYTENGKEKGTKTGSEIYGNVKAILDSKDQELKKFYNIASSTGYSFEKGGAGYEKLRQMATAQLVAETDYKGAIQVVPSKVSENGQILEVVLKVPYKKTKGGEQSVSTKMSKPINFQEFQASNPDLHFESKQRTPYDASYGDNCGDLFIAKSYPRQNLSANNPLIVNIPQIARDASAAHTTEKVQTVLNNFDQGSYSFKLERIDNKRMGVKMYQGSSLKHTYDLGVQTVETDDAVEYQTDLKETIISNTVIDYINRINGK